MNEPILKTSNYLQSLPPVKRIRSLDPNDNLSLLPKNQKEWFDKEIFIDNNYVEDLFYYDGIYDDLPETGERFNGRINRGYIYILQSGTGDIKIGKSVDILHRLESHKTGNPYIRLIDYAPVKYMSQSESILHKLCDRYRIHSRKEWFTAGCLKILNQYFNLAEKRELRESALIQYISHEAIGILKHEDFDPILIDKDSLYNLTFKKVFDMLSGDNFYFNTIGDHDDWEFFEWDEYQEHKTEHCQSYGILFELDFNRVDEIQNDDKRLKWVKKICAKYEIEVDYGVDVSRVRDFCMFPRTRYQKFYNMEKRFEKYFPKILSIVKQTEGSIFNEIEHPLNDFCEEKNLRLIIDSSRILSLDSDGNTEDVESRQDYIDWLESDKNRKELALKWDEQNDKIYSYDAITAAWALSE
jgi:hypothetical protein